MPMARCCSSRSRASCVSSPSSASSTRSRARSPSFRAASSFSVELVDGPARGYICENYGGAFTLPERGPIGANCLANPRDFMTPVAAYEDRDAPRRSFTSNGAASFSRTTLGHSPLDVVAWHGNYAPYKYDLRRFSPVGAILYRSSRPLDLHRADRAIGDAGHGEYRLRDFSGALAGRGKHLPPALVPHEHHVANSWG